MVPPTARHSRHLGRARRADPGRSLITKPRDHNVDPPRPHPSGIARCAALVKALLGQRDFSFAVLRKSLPMARRRQSDAGEAVVHDRGTQALPVPHPTSSHLWSVGNAPAHERKHGGDPERLPPADILLIGGCPRSQVSDNSFVVHGQVLLHKSFDAGRVWWRGGRPTETKIYRAHSPGRRHEQTCLCLDGIGP